MSCIFVDLVKNALFGSTERLHHEGQDYIRHELG
jgi:hypothetical protein